MSTYSSFQHFITSSNLPILIFPSYFIFLSPLQFILPLSLFLLIFLSYFIFLFFNLFLVSLCFLFLPTLCFLFLPLYPHFPFLFLFLSSSFFSPTHFSSFALSLLISSSYFLFSSLPPLFQTILRLFSSSSLSISIFPFYFLFLSSLFFLFNPILTLSPHPPYSNFPFSSPLPFFQLFFAHNVFPIISLTLYLSFLFNPILHPFLFQPGHLFHLILTLPILCSFLFTPLQTISCVWTYSSLPTHHSPSTSLSSTYSHLLVPPAIFLPGISSSPPFPPLPL